MGNDVSRDFKLGWLDDRRCDVLPNDRMYVIMLTSFVVARARKHSDLGLKLPFLVGSGTVDHSIHSNSSGGRNNFGNGTVCRRCASTATSRGYQHRLPQVSTSDIGQGTLVRSECNPTPPGNCYQGCPASNASEMWRNKKSSKTML